MSEQIDILSTPYNMGAQFTVNTAVNSVDLVQCVPGIPQIMTAGGGTILGGGYEFSNGDNFEILSAGYQIPENFVMSQYDVAAGGEQMLPIMYLQADPVGAAPAIPVTQFGNNGTLRMPFECYELSLGTFVDITALGVVGTGGGFVLQMLFPFLVGVDNPRVSMINVPAALNGEIIQVTPFIKVRHNFTLT